MMVKNTMVDQKNYMFGPKMLPLSMVAGGTFSRSLVPERRDAARVRGQRA